MRHPLDAALDHARMTQAELADRIGISSPTISQMKAGRISPFSRWKQIADVLGVDVTTLTNGAQEPVRRRRPVPGIDASDAPTAVSRRATSPRSASSKRGVPANAKRSRRRRGPRRAVPSGLGHRRTR